MVLAEHKNNRAAKDKARTHLRFAPIVKPKHYNPLFLSLAPEGIKETGKSLSHDELAESSNAAKLQDLTQAMEHGQRHRSLSVQLHTTHSRNFGPS